MQDNLDAKGYTKIKLRKEKKEKYRNTHYSYYNSYEPRTGTTQPDVTPRSENNDDDLPFK